MADFRTVLESEGENNPELEGSCTLENSYVCLEDPGIHFSNPESEDNTLEKILINLENTDPAELSQIQNTLSSLVRSKLQQTLDMKIAIEQRVQHTIQQIESDSSHFIESFLTAEIEFCNQKDSIQTKKRTLQLSSIELIALVAEEVLNGESLEEIDSRSINKLIAPSLFFNPRNLIGESIIELRNLKFTNSKIEAEIDKLKKENERLKSENGKLKSENSKLSSENNKLKSENGNYKNVQKSLAKIKTELKNCNTGNSRLSKANKELKNENAKLIQKLNNLQLNSSRSQIKLTNQSDKERVKNLNEKIKNQAKHIHSIDKINVKNKNRIIQLENQLKGKEVSVSKNKNKKYRKKINNQKEEINNLIKLKNAAIKDKESSLKASANKIRDLENTNKNLRNQINSRDNQTWNKVNKLVKFQSSDSDEDWCLLDNI